MVIIGIKNNGKQVQKMGFYLHVGLFFVLMRCVSGDCLFPEDELENGEFIYTSPNDINRTTVPEYYILGFHCIYGHTVIGSTAIACIEGQWTDDVPLCKKLWCPDPPIVRNGKEILRSGKLKIRWLGSSVTYSCDEGFEFVEDFNPPLRCVWDEISNSPHWLGNAPTCEEKEMCRDPGVSPDGRRSGECCLPGNILQFYCNENFELVGNQEIECLPNGEWSSERPLCRPNEDYCEHPPAIRYGVVTGKKQSDYFKADEEAEIICDPGYTYKGPSNFVLCEDGKWDVDFGECTELFCDAPMPLANGTILELESTNATSFPFLFQLTYVCDPGYRLVGGDSWRFCEDTQWKGTTPHCEKIRCPDPKMPEYGSIEGDSFEIGAKVRFKCFAGYDLLGSIERYCLPNGQWSGELARCNLNSTHCPNPGLPINGRKNSSNYELESIIGFWCDEGYILVGSEARKCLLNRTWSGTEPKCFDSYDYDIYTRVRRSLQFSLDNKIKVQRKIKKEYGKDLNRWFNGTREDFGRKLDLSHRSGLVLYFIFDVSSSVGKNNFDKSVEFAKAIVKRVGISEDGVRAGAIVFSSEAEVVFMPVVHSTTEDVLNALNEMNYTGGGTCASSALSLLREECIPLSQGVLGKQGQKSVVFVLTDGRANMGGNPKEEADRLKNENVEIYSIGITGSNLKKSLYDIASDPKEEHIFIFENYVTLSHLIQDITNGVIDYSKCGIGFEIGGSESVTGKVVNGNNVVQPWPWIAALFYAPGGILIENKVRCGGSIISEYFILTAAHCMFNEFGLINKADLYIKIGLTNINEESFIQKPEVERILLHPNYMHYLSTNYDIALLRLKKPIEFNSHITRICLPPLELPSDTLLYKAGEYGMSAGWGHDKIMLDMEFTVTNKVEHLKEITLPIQSRNTCEKTLWDNGRSAVLFTDKFFCAGDGYMGYDTCLGDSGGPFMQSQMNDEGVYWTQVGIVSWGIGCGLPNTYGFYTHVQSLRSWIDEEFRKLEEEIN